MTSSLEAVRCEPLAVMPAWTSVLALVAVRLGVAQAWVNTKNPPQPDGGYPQNALFCKSTTYRGEWGKQRGNTPLGGGNTTPAEYSPRRAYAIR